MTAELYATVAVLARADGHELWRQPVGGASSDSLEAIAVDGAGDASSPPPPSAADPTRREEPSPQPSSPARTAAGSGAATSPQSDRGGSPRTADHDASGDVVAAGVVSTLGPFGYPGSTAFTISRCSGADGALDVCGDGYADTGEECDDGNTSSSDCCSATCHRAPDGTAREDLNLCATDDVCRQGTCRGGPPSPL